MFKSLKSLVKSIPEVYQHIFMHPEYDRESSRICEDRERLILDIVQSFQKKTGRNDLRVLDIGCAQGYYSFLLNKLGCRVDGIDIVRANVNLCRALNVEQGMNVKFDHQDLTLEFAESIPDGTYDFILILSVLHHIAQKHGFPYALKVVNVLKKKTKNFILELAIKDEPVYWHVSQPENWTLWVQDIPFYKEVAYLPTHLSNVKRPLVFCSNEQVLIGNDFYKIDTFFEKSFVDGVRFSNKRYFFAQDKLIKYYRRMDGDFVSNYHYNELDNEVSLLTKYRGEMSFFPKIVNVEREEKFILAVMDYEKGELLYDMIKSGKEYDPEKVIYNVLENLVALEKHGLYHNDIRTWNVIVKKDKSFLIDVGAIRPDDKSDCMDHSFGVAHVSVFHSLCSFIVDVLKKQDAKEISERGFSLFRRNIFFQDIPGKYKNFFRKIFSNNQENITFSTCLSEFESIVLKGEDPKISIDDSINFIINGLSELQSDYHKLTAELAVRLLNIEKRLPPV